MYFWQVFILFSSRQKWLEVTTLPTFFFVLSGTWNLLLIGFWSNSIPVLMLELICWEHLASALPHQIRRTEAHLLHHCTQSSRHLSVLGVSHWMHKLIWCWQNTWAWKLCSLGNISFSQPVYRSSHHWQVLFFQSGIAYLFQIGTSHPWHHSSLWFHDVFPDDSWHRNISSMSLNVVECCPFIKVVWLYQIIRSAGQLLALCTTRYPALGTSY